MCCEFLQKGVFFPVNLFDFRACLKKAFITHNFCNKSSHLISPLPSYFFKALLNIPAEMHKPLPYNLLWCLPEIQTIFQNMLETSSIEFQLKPAKSSVQTG